MQLRPLYNIFLKELKPMYGYDEAVAITNIIFEDKAGISRATVIAAPETEITPGHTAILEDALLQLKRSRPVQYITGHTWFYQLHFKVNEAVLIPRPETEELVAEAIQFISINKKNNCIDIGTGSGCIPIAIKKNSPALQVSAIDVSNDALNVAKENAALNDCEVNFMLLDFLNENDWESVDRYDVITSNPPYIPLAEKKLLASNVADHEPSLALFVPDDDQLLFYKKIAAFGKKHLNKGGHIFMETHMEYAGEVAGYFRENGYEAIVKKDIFEKDRIVIATQNHSLLQK